MGIQKECILLRLQELEEANGGYFGTDTTSLAKVISVQTSTKNEPRLEKSQ